MKKYKILVGLIFSLLLIVLLIFILKKNNSGGSDYRVGFFADNGIAIVSFSGSRKMVNLLKVSPEAKIWIPEGMGWYRSEVVKKIVSQENKKNLYDEILFYNFGFKADKIVLLRDINNWRSKLWLRIKLSKLIYKDEQLDNDIDIKSDWLDKIMMRDFSESKIFTEDLKLSVINTGKETGLAGFIGKDLERMGFSVTSVTSDESTKIDGCVLFYGNNVEKTYSWTLLKEIFDCSYKKESSLNDDEVELYFDDKFASVIKYSSYKK